MDFLTMIYIVCGLVTATGILYAVGMITLGVLASLGNEKAQIVYDWATCEYED